MKASIFLPAGRLVILLLMADTLTNVTLCRAAPLITSVVESGGDGGTTIPAKFTGQTFTNTAGFGIITVGLFGEDAPAYSDRGHQWNSVTNPAGVAIGMPPYLVNGEYIVPGNDRRDNQLYSLTLTTMTSKVYVYLLIDNRGSITNGQPRTPPDIGIGTNSLGLPFMNWVLTNGFVPVHTGRNRSGSLAIPDEVGMDESPSLGVGAGVSVNSYCSVYGRSLSGTRDTIVLGEYAAGGSGRSMYGVVVSTNAPVPTITAITADPTGGVAVTFTTIGSAGYSLEHKDALTSGQWQTRSNSVTILPDTNVFYYPITWPGFTNTMTLGDPSLDPDLPPPIPTETPPSLLLSNRFYRVRVSP
ncbi:MAG: hypothetical protein HZA89_04605 [Verrucomicrobia bacterium]|nr:hypothetical protein [Verrucomicrobiota bacterium]